MQIYRITARDALPPAGALPHLDSSGVSGLDSSVVVVGGGENAESAASDGDLPMPSTPVEAEVEAEELAQELDEGERAEPEAAVGVAIEEEGGLDVCGADGVALSKGGGSDSSSSRSNSSGDKEGIGMSVGEENAPSFEKVNRKALLYVLVWHWKSCV